MYVGLMFHGIQRVAGAQSPAWLALVEPASSTDGGRYPFAPRAARPSAIGGTWRSSALVSARWPRPPPALPRRRWPGLRRVEGEPRLPDVSADAADACSADRTRHARWRAERSGTRPRSRRCCRSGQAGGPRWCRAEGRAEPHRLAASTADWALRADRPSQVSWKVERCAMCGSPEALRGGHLVPATGVPSGRNGRGHVGRCRGGEFG